MNAEARGAEKNWLVKSSTRILGPYTLTELTELLRSRQVSIIDEVRLPEGRWGYVRENQIFMDIVKNIRDEQDSFSDDTMTHSVAQHTAITRTDTGPMTDDLTPTPATSNFDLTPPPVRDGMKDVTPSGEKLSTRAQNSTSAKSYGASGDPRLQGQIRRKLHVWRWILLAAAVGVGIVVALNLNHKEKKKSLGYDEFMAQAIRYKSLGLYEKSLQAYTKASRLREPDFESQVQMAPVLISEDRQSLVGRRILEKALIQDGRGRAEMMNAYLGIAVSYIMDGEFKQAEEILQKAMGHEPFNLSILLNLAILKQKKGNYAEAMRDFDEIHRKNSQSVLALFGRSLATVEYAKDHLDTHLVQSLIRDIKTNLQKTGYLRQELLLFIVYAQSLLGDVDGVNQAVVQFLSQMSGQSRNYAHSLQVEWRFTQWDYLEKYCAEIYQKQTPHPELKAMRATCLMEVNRDSEAEKLLQEALAEAPRDPYVLATQASYLSKIGRIPEASSILKMPELQNLAIKDLLMGDICINAQDVSCAQRAYTSVYNQDKKNVAALFGLGWVVLHNKDRASAYEYVRAGLQMEPNYLPLIELRDQLEYE